MGLPIWTDPDEAGKVAKNSLKNDPTASARSSIRRRPSVHGSRTARPRLTRQGTPARNGASGQQHGGRDAGTNSGRRAVRGVPPVATLLESAERRIPPSLPPSLVVDSSGQIIDPNGLGPASRSLREARAQRHRRPSPYRSQPDGSRRQAPAATVVERQADLMAIHRAGADAHRSADADSQAMEEALARRGNLPTPPADASEPDDDSLFVPEIHRAASRGLHPLRQSWNHDSATDGLGDRNRSPTPADGWEIMRSTITPDATLPSADSSFTSAVVSQSFGRGDNPNTAEHDDMIEISSSHSGSGRDTSDEEDTDSSEWADDHDTFENELMRNEERFDIVADYARNMYQIESAASEGRERLERHEVAQSREGNRFALMDEPRCVEIGFRLIEEALDTREGHERLLRARMFSRREDLDLLEEAVTLRQEHVLSEFELEPSSPRPERHSDETRTAAREATAQVHNYFRRFTADALFPPSGTGTGSRSPPPQYEPLSSHPDVGTFTSRDGPHPHPVSPPTLRSQREVTDSLLSGDETDLGAMRRVVERLARRDDVPEEWWTSIGLNLSRVRPARERSPVFRETGNAFRVAAGRSDRRDSRL